MFVLNFTEAAAKHFCPEYKKGSPCDFFEEKSSETVEELFKKSKPKEAIIFVVHVVKNGRYHNAIVVEFGTRWCHVIHKVKKRDMGDLIERLSERLVNAIAWEGERYKIFDSEQMGNSAHEFLACHRLAELHVRSDTSCNSHITQITYDYEAMCHRSGGYPRDETEAIELDLHLNNVLRKRKGAADYFSPRREMVSRYLSDYMRFADAEVSEAIAKIRERDRAEFDKLIKIEMSRQESNVFKVFEGAISKTVH